MTRDAASPMDGRTGSAKSRQRWELILSASTALFNERGFAGTSMQDVSDRVGIQKGSLYYYVKSKEMLLFEILRDLHRGGEVLIGGIDFEAADPLDEIRRFLRHVGVYAGQHADRLRIFLRDFDHLPPEHQRLIIRERRMYRQTMERLIQRAIERGEIAPALDTTVIVQVSLRAISSIADWYRPGGPFAVEQVAEQVALMVVNGLAAAPRA